MKLLQLKNPFYESHYIRPIDMVTEKTPEPNTDAVLLVWGSDEYKVITFKFQNTFHIANTIFSLETSYRKLQFRLLLKKNVRKLRESRWLDKYVARDLFAKYINIYIKNIYLQAVPKQVCFNVSYLVLCQFRMR